MGEFMVGMWLGCMIGVFMMCLCAIAGDCE